MQAYRLTPVRPKMCLQFITCGKLLLTFGAGAGKLPLTYASHVSFQITTFCLNNFWYLFQANGLSLVLSPLVYLQITNWYDNFDIYFKQISSPLGESLHDLVNNHFLVWNLVHATFPLHEDGHVYSNIHLAWITFYICCKQMVSPLCESWHAYLNESITLNI